MTNCTNCGASIDELAIFPGGICLECHAAKFDRYVRLTKTLPVPDFRRIYEKPTSSN